MTMTGPELGFLLGGPPAAPTLTPELVEQIAHDTLAEFLGNLDPAALEAQALARLGSLDGGDDSVGGCFIAVLKESAGVD